MPPSDVRDCGGGGRRVGGRRTGRRRPPAHARTQKHAPCRHTRDLSVRTRRRRRRGWPWPGAGRPGAGSRRLRAPRRPGPPCRLCSLGRGAGLRQPPGGGHKTRAAAPAPGRGNSAGPADATASRRPVNGCPERPSQAQRRRWTRNPGPIAGGAIQSRGGRPGTITITMVTVGAPSDSDLHGAAAAAEEAPPPLYIIGGPGAACQ